ncbi:MAG: Type II secretion system F domain, type IV pilus assembly protein PilC, partial [Candidatus Peregrinibacteria bacterium GW2011_GWF2_33_10]
MATKDLLEQFNLNSEVTDNEEVIYGVYDNRKSNVFVRINDFLIDHSKINIKDKSYFFYLLAVMVDSGIPLVKALKVLVDRTENKRLRRIIATIAYNMENKGETLARSMEKFVDIFTESEIGIVKSGEESGQIDKMLFKLAKQLEGSYELSLEIKGALIYPVTVISALIVAGAIVVIFVVPKLQTFFTENNVSLPLPTEMLMNISGFFAVYWWALCLIIIAGIFLGNFYVSTDSGKFKWHYYLLKTPLIGSILIKVYIVRFVRLLEVLVESGLPITKILKTSAEAIGNEVYKRKLLDTAEQVSEGVKLSDSLAGASLIFPESLVEMLRVGESSASIDKS